MYSSCVNVEIVWTDLWGLSSSFVYSSCVNIEMVWTNFCVLQNFKVTLHMFLTGVLGQVEIAKTLALNCKSDK